MLHASPKWTVSTVPFSADKLGCSIPEITDYFLAGDDQPQTNQPIGQAGG